MQRQMSGGIQGDRRSLGDIEVGRQAKVMGWCRQNHMTTCDVDLTVFVNQRQTAISYDRDGARSLDD